MLAAPFCRVRAFVLGTMALSVLTFGVFALGGSSLPAAASTMDAANCLGAAEDIDAGETLSPQERKEAHEACRRALAATGSVLQKYQFQEADFLITGKRNTF